MLRILGNTEGVIVHMDDILVYGKNKSEHDKRLNDVLQKIKSAGETLNHSKCEFGKANVTFLGHRVDSEGIHASEEQIQSILNFYTPTPTRDIQSFLGLAISKI